MTSVLTFDVENVDGGDAVALVPFVDGRSLVDLVAAFEAIQGYEPSGGYWGIVPAHFDFGDLELYLEGRGERQWPKPGHAWLLGCNCGEVGCWPLTARIIVTPSVVTWSDFSQEHRDEWDYRGFGPSASNVTSTRMPCREPHAQRR